MPDERNYCAEARKYAEDVVSGEIPACEWVRAACKRQLDDLERSIHIDYAWTFNQDRGNDVCWFIERLPHVKGRWSKKTIELVPWQCFYLTTIFGWVSKETGFRRFRKALIVIPRKNAKSTIAAGVGLYLLTLDNEPGAEVYSAATTRDQAKIVWGEYARKMVQQTPKLKERYGLEALAHSITVENAGSFFKPLSRDADSLEGLNVHGAIIDELHAHGTREVFDVLDEATGSRRQPLIFIISTEGDNPDGVFAEQVEYGQQVLRGTHEDERYFSILYTIDKQDDWTAPESWRKANPNLGVSVLEEDLRARYNQAQLNAQSQASFLTKRLNVRVGAGDAYFNMLAWNTVCKESGLTMDDVRGERCLFALDLASKRDLTTRVAVFRRGADYVVFGKHYVPSDAIVAGMPNYDVYRGWQRDGRLSVTEGNRTDYAFVERDLVEDVAAYKPEQVGIDPNYNAAHFVQNMQAENVPIVEVAHNVTQFSNAMKELDALIVAGRIKHDGDPVLAWALGNVVAKVDVKGNVYPRKARDVNKIDPAVALIANMSLWLKLEEPQWDFTVMAV